MSLYQVKTVLPEFRGHRDVSIHWFVTERASLDQRPPYAEAIVNYDATNENHQQYAEGAVDELFGHAEAEAFVEWLKSNDFFTDGTTKIVEAALPIPENTCGLCAIPLGGSQECLEIVATAKRRGIPWGLGVHVSGYFDLRGHGSDRSYHL
jgi:hypothetical protein